MDLKNGAITVGEVLRHPGAFPILQRYFPQIAGNALMLGIAKSWTLNQVLNRASGRVEERRIQQIRAELEQLE